MIKKEIVLFWSGGKDSALTLFELIKNKDIKVIALISMIGESTNTVAYHGISESLLVEQSKLIGIPLHRVYIPENCTNSQYTQITTKALSPYLKRGIQEVAFGDISLRDIRSFREALMSKIGLKSIFPLWGKSNQQLQELFFNANFRTVITSILTDKLDHSFLGKELSRELLTKLPENIDPFGENGEFHTLTTFAPYFKLRLQTSISITKTEGPYEVCQVRCP